VAGQAVANSERDLAATDLHRAVVLLGLLLITLFEYPASVDT